MLWQCAAYVAFAFLMGSVLFSYHLPLWLKKVDVVAQSADHNPGTANAFKGAGVGIGLLCLLCDMGKGFVPVWLAVRARGISFPLLPLVLLAPVAGHAFSPWYPFGGGKAIATAFGVLIGLLPFSKAVWVLVIWYLFFSLAMVIRPNEKRSVAAFLCFAATTALIGLFGTHRPLVALGCALISAVPIAKNYRDLARAEAALPPKEAQA